MVARAKSRFIRISPRKLRLVLRLVKGKNVMTALSELSSINKKAARFAYNTIQSAFSNARRKTPDKKLTEADFYISKITCDSGPMFKRFRAASLGRAMMIRRRTSHLLVELNEVPGKKPDAGRPAKKPKRKAA